jgi:hypothetical protein
MPETVTSRPGGSLEFGLAKVSRGSAGEAAPGSLRFDRDVTTVLLALLLRTVELGALTFVKL